MTTALFNTVIQPNGIRTLELVDPEFEEIIDPGDVKEEYVVGPAVAVDDNVATFDGVTGKLIQDGGSPIPATGFGDVVGPGVSVDDNVATFDGVTGKLIQDGGSPIPPTGFGDVTAAANMTANTLIVGDDGAKGVKDIAITVTNDDELGAVSRVDLLADSSENTWYGYQALNVATGDFNTALGDQAGLTISTGISNTLIGRHAGTLMADGNLNTAVGKDALVASTSDDGNTAIGDSCMVTCDGGDHNTAVGSQSLNLCATGNSNVAMGYQCAIDATGSNNVYIGELCADNATSGIKNTVVGYRAFNNVAAHTGSNNICLGSGAGGSLTTTDSSNICISSSGVGGDNAKIRIGIPGIHDGCFVQGVHNVTPAGATETVIIDANGELGSAASGGGSGDVVGPGVAVDSRLALFDGVTGKLIKQSTTITDVAGVLGGVASVTLTANGLDNTGYGFDALTGITTGFDNTAFGDEAMTANTEGKNNSGYGHRCLTANTDGDSNSGYGENCLVALDGGTGNTASGVAALASLQTGDDNIAMGRFSGDNYTTNESDNIIIGNTGTGGDNQTIRIGSTHTSCHIKGIHGITPAGATQTVIIGSAGELGGYVATAAVQKRNGSSVGLSGTLTAITWPTLDIEVDATIVENTSSSEITVKRAGYYQIIFNCILDLPNDDEVGFHFQFRKNGVDVLYGGVVNMKNYQAASDKENDNPFHQDVIVLLAANDIISVWCRDQSGSLNMKANHYFSVKTL